MEGVLGSLEIHSSMKFTTHFSRLTRQQRTPKNRLPYIYDMYNIRCFTANPLSEVRNVAARLVNALIKALNDAEKLPKMVLILPDWDLLRFVNYTDRNAEVVLEEMLNWIINNMKRAQLKLRGTTS